VLLPVRVEHRVPEAKDRYEVIEIGDARSAVILATANVRLGCVANLVREYVGHPRHEMCNDIV
jgi:hypothetical protein